MSVMPEQFDQAFWDDRYRSAASLWSGEANPHLVTEAEGLTPGTALDAGAGEGADALWLAGRGWRVTAVDISAVALERGAAHAATIDDDGLAGRISWRHHDLTSWVPPAGSFDLVSAQYLHLPLEPRQALHDRLAAAVAPGGTLLLVGHHPSDRETTVPRPQLADLFFTGDDIVARLDRHHWEIVTNAAPGRSATDPEGRTVTVHDTVVRAVRQA
jgi:SAM-dependent methyltransferase